MLSAFGRPVAWNLAGLLPVVASVEAASRLIPTAAPELLRDGGREASTSYGPACQEQRASALSASQRRAYGTLAERLASAPADVAAGRSNASQPQPTSGAAASASSPTPAPAAPAEDVLAGLDMESLLSALLHPLPLGRTRNTALFSGAAAPAVQLGGSLFFDPAQTLSSTMRALTVIRQVLREDGHVLIVNPNPAMRPLLREAAHLCLNSNVWFWYRDWTPGALSDPKRGIADVLKAGHAQPNKRIMAARGLALRNPLCPERPASAPPALSAVDIERLIRAVRSPRDTVQRRETHAALASLMAARSTESRLLPAGTPSYASLGRKERLSLVVSLDLSYGGEAVREAYERNIPTVSLLNGHSDASRVAFPVFASEAHAGFQHFFLDWLLRVANVRLGPAEGKQGK